MSDDFTDYDRLREAVGELVYEFELPDILQAMIAEVEAMDWPEGELATAERDRLWQEVGILAETIKQMIKLREVANGS